MFQDLYFFIFSPVTSQIFSFFVGFFGEVKKTKIASEIIWPLGGAHKLHLQEEAGTCKIDNF